MTVQVVRRDGNTNIYEAVKRLELDETKGDRVKIVQEFGTVSSLFCDFVSVTVLKTTEEEL